MTPTLRRILGIILIISAVGGLLFGLVGMISLWFVKGELTQNLLGTMEVLETTLAATSEGLEIANQSLATSIGSVGALREAVETTAAAIDATTPMMDTMITLAGEDLPETVETTQTSLRSAQESARVIDNFLNSISRVPIISGWVDYNPERPLNEALNEVSISMGELPQSLATIEQSLSESSDNLQVIQADISLMVNDLSEIETSLSDGQLVVSEYQAVTADLQSRLDRMQAQIPIWMDTGAWVLTFVLLWSTAGQLGILALGFDMLERAKAEWALGELDD